MRAPTTFAALLLLTLPAHAQTMDWSALGGRMTLTAPESWERWEKQDGYDLLLESYDDDDETLHTCYVKISNNPNPTGAPQNTYNAMLRTRNAETIVATAGGTLLRQSRSTVSGVEIMRFSVQAEGDNGPEEQTHLQFAIANGQMFHPVMISCAMPISASAATRSEVDAFLASVSIKAD